MTRVYRARWVVPISSPPVADGAVAVEGDTIAWVGPAREAPAGDVSDLGEAVLLPGLVNTHTHLELTAMRGFLEDLDFRRWILTLTHAKRESQSREMLLDAARLGIAEGLLAGITTFADTCDSGVAFDAMLEAGVRGIMYQEVFGPSPTQASAAMTELRAKVDALRPRATALVRVGISPHAPYTVSDTLFATCAAYARGEQLPMAVHIAESEMEAQLVTEAAGPFADGLRRRGIPVSPRARSPIALLIRTGMLDARPLLIHCVRVDAEDLRAIAGLRCAVAHCPASNAKLGHGVAPLLEMLAAGIDVGLGSDSVASNNHMDLLGEARLAVLMQRARAGVHDGITATRALEMATVGGARALGLAGEIGTLERGKQADLAAFSFDDTRGTPSLDPATALVFALPGRCARLTVVAGRELVRDGALVHADATLAARVQAACEALREWRAAQGRDAR